MHDNPRQISFSCCCSYLVIFLIAIQTWTSTSPFGYTGLMAIAVSAASPGEISPNARSILIGGEANITCTLSEPQSSRIWFMETKSRRRITQPSEEIKVIDDFTAVLMIRNAKAQKSLYRCQIGEYAIGESELYVGTKPLNVTDFFCITDDYKKMDCNFTIPENMILTKFDLEFHLDNSNQIYHCSCKSLDNRKMNCSVDDYMPIRETYIFKLTGTNDVGENIQQFIKENNKIVKPPSVNIVETLITSDSIHLDFENLKMRYYSKFGMSYDVQIRDENSSWRTAHMGELEYENGICKILISDLYPYWLYSIKVRVKSNGAENDRFWSDESFISFRTQAERPKRAPEIPVGSFYIDSMETKLRLYWENMPKHEHNGPDFRYIVSEANVYGDIMLNTTTTEPSATFLSNNESIQIFIVKSANNVGESLDKSVIHVYRSANPQYELNENKIAKVYHNTSYSLSWAPPENVTDLMNYTVFWCLPKIELPNQCKGPISFKYIEKSATNFTIEPKDHSLNLAISANYPNYTKGMQWARCSGDISSELMKMELEVNAVNESAIVVKWSSGSVCASILKGYNLTYCVANMENECIGHSLIVQLLRETYEYTNYTITNLPPDTNVCLSMFMYSLSKQGRNSEKNCIKTKESAPSPPKNVKYHENTITSKSVQIQWSPPDVKNGVLRNYTVYWRKYPDITFEKNTTSTDQLSYNLTELNSYSNYEVYVTAHTIAESAASNHINFITLIGIPSVPRNVNIYDNNTILYWDQPDLPSGRHLFYIVALTRRENSFNEIYEKVSIVRGRTCRFKQPNCINSNKSYALKVRAVNVGSIDEVDLDIVPMSKDAILAEAEIDETLCVSDEAVIANSFEIKTKSIFENSDKRFYFASPWIVAPRSYTCSINSKTTIYYLVFLAIIIVASYSCYWLRCKYIEMSNIKVVLPGGLAEHLTNYQIASNTLVSTLDLRSTIKKEFLSDISGSNDCLVSYGDKGSLNLINSFHQGSSNALSAISSNGSPKKHPSLETTNEEISSNCSSTSKYNMKYNDNLQIKILASNESNNTSPELSYEENEYVPCDRNEHSPDVGDMNYMRVQSAFLYVNQRSVPPKSQFNATFPALANDGDIQPSAEKQLPALSNQQPQPLTALSDYTSVESLCRLNAPEGLQNLSNIATSQSITNPSPISNTDRQESSFSESSKDALHPRVKAISAANILQQPSSNNTIDGYVTQQQLANFGTNVVLGKELCNKILKR